MPAVALAVAVVGAPVAQAAPDADSRCQRVELSVTDSGLPASPVEVGTLCDPASGPSRTLQVLVHGFTLNRRYWDFPGFGGRYSYVAAMNRAGYSTLAIDQIGAGESSKPSGLLLTVQVDAAGVHDAVRAARDGSLGGHRFDRVALVGHSYGSSVALVEAATYHDADAVVVTGLNHGISAPTLLDAAVNSEPAVLDPRLGPGVHGDLTYLTTRPGARDHLFFADADADPDVVAEEEDLKDVGSPVQLTTLPEFEVATPTLRLPVLVAVGQLDRLNCLTGLGLDDCTSAASERASEAFLYPRAALTAYVLAGSGHNMNLHRNAPDWFAFAADWFHRTLPADG